MYEWEILVIGYVADVFHASEALKRRLSPADTL